jgi:hypothetical protein
VPAMQNVMNVCNNWHKFCPILCSSMKINLHMMVLTTQRIFALWCNKIHIEA